MENKTRIDEFLRQIRQVNEALRELQHSFPENSRAALHSDGPRALREALAGCRGIRPAYALFYEQFQPFEEKACYLLSKYEKEYCRQEGPQERQPGEETTGIRVQSSRKKGTPKYEQLAAMPGWPRLFNAEAAANDYNAALEVYYLDQPTNPARGSFEQRTFAVRSKHLKWAQRSESALHQYCGLLTEFQRYCDRTNAGRAGKRELARLLLEQLNEKQRLERMIVGAILEAAEER